MRGRTSRHADGQRSSIGDIHVNNACVMLNRAALREAAMFIPKRVGVDYAVPLMFDPDTIARAQAARGIIDPRTDVIRYRETGPSKLFSGVSVQLSYTNCAIPPISPKYFHPQLGFAEIAETVRTIQDIHFKYGRVKQLLRWFNRNATAAAIRNYWPSVLQLCGKSSVWEGMIETPPARYQEPSELSTILPLIRETVGTVATMALAGDEAGHTVGTVKVLLDECTRTWEDIPVLLDEQTYIL